MFAYDVPFEDFKKRQLHCQREAQKRGFKGIYVCSRGGGTFDRYAGADYLANHYQQRCYLPDQPPLWSGRSHSLLLIPAHGELVLLVTTGEYRRDLVAVKDVRYGVDFFQLVADTAAELGMDEGECGLIYEDVMTHRIYRSLMEKMPALTMVPCDGILEEMRTVKSPREIISVRKACEIGSRALELIMAGVRPGKTESEVIAPGIEHVVSQGGTLYFVVANSGKDKVPVHSLDFPGYDSLRPMEESDLFKVDLIIVYEGYICDFGRSCIVGEGGSEDHKKMIKLVTEACEHVIQNVRGGLSVKELCRIGDAFLCDQGVSLSAEQKDPSQIYAAFPPHWGHGIGMTWERPWMIDDESMVLKKDMFIAIEKGLYQPGMGTVTYEQNLLVTDTGYELLTTTKSLWI